MTNARRAAHRGGIALMFAFLNCLPINNTFSLILDRFVWVAHF